MFREDNLVYQKQQSHTIVTALADDNISDLLLKVVSFTGARRKIILQNIKNLNRPGFVPKDLPSAEFADSLNTALNEHITRRRLLLCDGKNVSFGQNGGFELKTVIDKKAEAVLKRDKDKYIEMQTGKLVENTLNQKLATVLLGGKTKRITFRD